MKIRGQQIIPIEERLQRSCLVNPKTSCWEWLGAKRNGYGRIVVGSRTDGSRKFTSSHRLSYEVFVGPIGPGLEICHKCDNRSCINPDHLFAGTRQDNIDDRESKGRNNPRSGESHPKSKLSESDVLNIRALSSEGATFGQLAKQFSVNKKSIIDIAQGKNWKHLLPKPPGGE